MINGHKETSKSPKLPDGCVRATRAPGIDPKWVVDRMTPDDISSILQIEQDSQPDPWTGGLFQEELNRPQAHVLVARTIQGGTNLLGYICFWEVADEIQILNISVHRSYRRRGIGRCLVREALLHGKRRKAKVALLEVRRNNMAARKFYASMGFKAEGERPDYYGPGESAILMELDLVNLPQSTRK